MKFVRKLLIIFDCIIDYMHTLAGILVIVALLSITASVATRYFLGKPIAWADEICGYILLYVTFLAAAWVLKIDGHVRIEIVVQRLKSKTRALLDAITSAISAAVCLILTWYSFKVTLNLFRTKYFTPTIMELPKFIFTAVIVIGSLMLCIEFLRRTGGLVRSYRSSRENERGNSKREGR